MLGVAVLVVAVIGLLVNVAGLRLLTAHVEALHGAQPVVATTTAATITPIEPSRRRYADPLIGAGIGLLILPRTCKLAAQALRILIETPRFRRRGGASPAAHGAGVAGGHDLHVWTLADGADGHHVLDGVTALLAEGYSVAHSTIRCEPAGHTDREWPI